MIADMTVSARPLSGRMLITVIVPAVVSLLAMLAARISAFPGICFDIAWTCAAISALAGCLAARSRALPDNRPRWTLWSLAAGSWLAGQLAWNLFGITGFPASPNVADFAWWAYALLVLASVLRVPRSPRSLQLVAALESASLALAAAALLIAALWSTASGSSLPWAGRISALLYPILYAAATMAMLQAAFGGRLRGLHERSVQLALGGIFAQALAFALWSVQLLQRSYVPGRSALDPLWVLGLVAIGIGGLLAARRPEQEVGLAEHSQQVLILPSAAMAVLLVGVAIAALSDGPAAASLALRMGVVCCGAALLIRSGLLARRMRTMLERERAALALLGEREMQLARLNEQLTEDSRRDPLTGLGNRRALSDDLAMLESRGPQARSSVAFVLCDVDHFKPYNDRLGHLAGDQALRMIAATARGALEPSGRVYRFGGEELLLVLTDATAAGALELAERLRAAVERAAYRHPAAANGILTVSAGVACGTQGFSELLAQADAALYEAKRTGRNRVALAGAATAQHAPVGRHVTAVEAPLPRHLRGMLAISRAAASGAGGFSLLELLASTIRSELGFHVVAVNLRDPEARELRVELVLGDPDARKALLGSSQSVSEWEQLLAAGEQISGAAFLRAGCYQWDADAPAWVSPALPHQAPDAWQPEDMLLLPLRGAAHELLGVVSVDQPLLGRRPSAEEIGVLMAVVDHAALALEQARRSQVVASPPDEPAELRLAAVMLLAETLDMRDPATARHARTVGELAGMTAQALGLSADRVQRIYAAGVLHDLGKLGVPDAILRKPGPLDQAEWAEMRRHPEIGARILELAGLHDVAGWVRSHHERLDGHGYPAGLTASQIPLESRILAVADAYEAMIAVRPYQPQLDPELARQELARCAGTQFDPEVVEAFQRALGGRAPAPALVSAA
jgi:diguanylate cyclase (GGDEF)-like protein